MRAATGRRPAPGEVRKVEEAYLRRLPAEVRRAVRERRYARIPGCSKLLKALDRRPGLLLGLGTGNVREGARIKLAPSGLLRYFRFGGFGKDGGSRAQMLRTAVRRASRLCGSRVRPRDVFVIGDTPRDVFAGRRAGYRTGTVTGGYGGAAELRRARPDFSRPDFRDLKAWLRWLGVK